MDHRRYDQGMNHPPETTTLDQEVSTLELLEDEFLSGNFRQALANANRYLQKAEEERQQARPLFMIHPFLLWQQDFVLCVHKETLDRDSVGAIAVQSWYELWQKQQQQRRSHETTTTSSVDETSQKHLMPFLETCCSNREESSSMSVELAWVWVKLLWALGEHETSLILATKLWKFCVKLAEPLESQSSFAQQGVDFLVTEALPRLKLEQDDPFWDAWWTKDDDDNNDTERFSELSTQPTLEARESLLRRLPDIQNLIGLSLDEAKQIENRLEDLPIPQQQKIQQNGDSEKITSLFDYPSFSSRESAKNVFLRLKRGFVQMIRAWIFGKVNGNDDRESSLDSKHRAMVIVMTVISAWISWRNRKRVVALLKRMLWMAVLPTRELVEAFIPQGANDDDS